MGHLIWGEKEGSPGGGDSVRTLDTWPTPVR